MNKKLIFASSHHKCGTVLLTQVLLRIAEEFNLSLVEGNKIFGTKNGKLDFAKGNPATRKVSNLDIFLDWSGLLKNVSNLNLPHKGIHLIRDPRNMIISGYFYHLKCKEGWCLEPDKRYKGLSFQEYLKSSKTQEEGLMKELKMVGEWTFKNMAEWNYNNKNFIEIKYENLMENYNDTWSNVFNFLEAPWFKTEQDKDKCILLAGKENVQKFSQENIKQRNASAKQGPHINFKYKRDRWREYFTPKIKQKFKTEYGDLLIKLGYENDFKW